MTLKFGVTKENLRFLLVRQFGELRLSHLHRYNIEVALHAERFGLMHWAKTKNVGTRPEENAIEKMIFIYRDSEDDAAIP